MHEVEARKQVLFSHASFNADVAHDLIDTNDDGDISAQELIDVMHKYNMEEAQVQACKDLIAHCDKEPDMEISLSKFREFVTPLTDMPYHPEPSRCLYKRGPEPTFEEKECQKMAWLESLLPLLTSTLTANAECDRLKMKYMIPSEDIFDEMDHNRSGFVSMAAFARWVRENCAYALSDNDMRVLQPQLDDARDGRITKEEFITCFSAPPIDEDLDEPLIKKKTLAAQPENNISKPAEKVVKPAEKVVKPTAPVSKTTTLPNKTTAPVANTTTIPNTAPVKKVEVKETAPAKK